MPIWTFVRHGQSEANAAGWFAGKKDSPLTELGREQAIAARGNLSADPVRAYCSDLSRARQTAQLLLEGRDTPLVEYPQLQERTVGDWEGQPIAELAFESLAILEQWRGRPPNGESLADAALRALPLLAELDDGRDALIVAHGALIRCLVGLVDDRPRERIGHYKPRNCEFIERDLTVGSWGSLLENVRAEVAVPEVVESPQHS